MRKCSCLQTVPSLKPNSSCLINLSTFQVHCVSFCVSMQPFKTMDQKSYKFDHK